MEEGLAWRSGGHFLPFSGGAGCEQSGGVVPQIQSTYFVCDHPLLYTVVLNVAAVTVSFLFSLLFSSKRFLSQQRISAFLSILPEGVGGKGAAAWGLISSLLSTTAKE